MHNILNNFNVKIKILKPILECTLISPIVSLLINYNGALIMVANLHGVLVIVAKHHHIVFIDTMIYFYISTYTIAQFLLTKLMAMSS